MHRKTLLVALLTCILLPAVASAQGDTDLAKGYYKLGVNLYNRADYEEALDQFQKAYKHSGKAALFHNIARCYESLGKHEEAVKHYERYLEEGKPADADVIKARIANLKRLIAKKKAREKPKPASQPAKPVTKPIVAPKPKPQPLKPLPVPAAPGRPMRTAGWVLVGVGGATLVAGLIMGGTAADIASSLEDQNATKQTEYESVKEEEDRGRAMETGMIIALAVGGAAVATGAVLLILDARKNKERRAWLAPTVTPGGAFVSGGFSF